MVDLTCRHTLKLPVETASACEQVGDMLKKTWKIILTLEALEMEAPEPNGINGARDNDMFCAADALQWYHPARSTCTLSLPAPHRQEVVTDDRGSCYPEGILFSRCSLDFWWRDGREIIRYSGDPQNSYLCSTFQSVSVVLKEAISQCDIRWNPMCQKTQATWSQSAKLWPERTDLTWLRSFWVAPMMHNSASILCDDCDAGASAPRNSLTPPPHPPTTLPPAPNETPYLLPLLCGMHTNRETGEGRQTEPQRPGALPGLNHQTYPSQRVK